ncbi:MULTISPECIES: DUF2905 domain-containing protein [unclassified Sporolactobacillus]|uniref:DUF2905 domain-containing protein n=2 Tax=unclassified Sporolactobacillus TaxID=2628533 RepID=UPI0023675167|nr:DUF2905 domain-containing protein [Sporolactobacillus sp. CQH2019]MDD9147677.1 DUF2905 domain-containing protein [Sporolactobacillus sp. CQH2019]
MGDLGRFLMITGAVLFVIGLCWPLIGRLPGDIFIKKGNVTFMFPIVTCIVISLVLSLIFYVMNHFR